MELVGVKDRIVADDGQALRLTLGDEHAVERVPVRAGEQSGASGVSGGDGKGFERFLSENDVEMNGKIGALEEFSNAGFRRDLPR